MRQGTACFKEIVFSLVAYEGSDEATVAYSSVRSDSVNPSISLRCNPLRS